MEIAHEFHDDCDLTISSSVSNAELAPAAAANCDVQRRLHADVATKIRDLVSEGETRQFVIRNLLRYLGLCMWLDTGA